MLSAHLAEVGVEVCHTVAEFLYVLNNESVVRTGMNDQNNNNKSLLFFSFSLVGMITTVMMLINIMIEIK
jgi:hypothetical protein